MMMVVELHGATDNIYKQQLNVSAYEQELLSMRFSICEICQSLL